MVNLMPDRSGPGAACAGDRFATLDKTAVQAVVTAQVEGSVTSRMQEITGEHSKDITGVLAGLVRDGLLTQNQRRWASYRWRRTPRYSSGDDSKSFGGGTPPKLPSGTPQTGWTGLAGCRGSSPRCPVAEPARKNKKTAGDHSGHPFSGSVKGAGWQRLNWRRWWIAMPRSCNRALTAMVREGVLELRHPDVRNRPDQRTGR